MKIVLNEVRKDAIKKLKMSAGEEKKPLIDAVVLMMELYAIAHREGILFLAEVVEEDWFKMSSYLKRVLMLIIDGVDEEDVAEIGASEYWTQNPQGITAMVYYIYLRGMVCIVRNDNYEKTKLLLQTLLPQNERKDFEKEMEETRAQH